MPMTQSETFEWMRSELERLRGELADLRDKEAVCGHKERFYYESGDGLVSAMCELNKQVSWSTQQTIQIEELTTELAQAKQEYRSTQESLVSMHERAEAAESQVERLKQALGKCIESLEESNVLLAEIHLRFGAPKILDEDLKSRTKFTYGDFARMVEQHLLPEARTALESKEGKGLRAGDLRQGGK